MSRASAETPWSERGAAYALSTPHRFGPSLPKLVALARPGPGDHCLDIGTGAGHTAAQLALLARQVYGLDPAEGMRRAAKETYGHLPNLAFVDGSGHATGFPDQTFDIVTARHTLHHHPSVPDTLAEAARVLKPGGRLVIVDEVTPNAEVEVWYDRLERERDPTHQRAYHLDEWRAFIRGAGLEWVVGDTDTSYKIEVSDWIARMNPDAEQEKAVRELLRRADEVARRSFHIDYQNGEAVAFEMPMALILAVKP